MRDSIPKVEIDKRDLDLGCLRDRHGTLHESICIKNIGNKVVEWKFVCPFPSMEDEESQSDGMSDPNGTGTGTGTSGSTNAKYCKPFYRYTPDRGYVVPGEVCIGV